MNWKKISLLFCGLLTIASSAVLCLVPPVSRDALIHHLAVPKLYLRHGGIYEIPFMPFSYFPMNLDLLYVLPLYFGNDIAPKFIHMAFAVLTSALVYRYLKGRINSEYGLLGALFFLSLPIIVKLSITVYVDLGLVFFSTAALLLVLKWLESGFRIRYLIYSSMLCGLAMGTKYNGLITFFLLTLFVPFLYARYSEKEKIKILEASKYGLIFSLISIAVFSPWMIRDFVWTGNPIYPLYDQWFNPGKHVEHHSIGIFAYRALAYHEKWWQILLLPIRIFFQGEDGNPQFFDGKLNPFLLIFPVFAFIRKGASSESIRRERKILVAFSVLYFTFAVFSSSLRIRYVSPIIPPLVILSVYGIREIFEWTREVSPSFLRKTALLAGSCSVFFALGLNGSYIYKQFVQLKPFDYILGKVDRDEYIERFRPEYATMKYINEKLPPDAKILFIFAGNRGYYCDRRYVFDMEWNKSMVKRILEDGHSAKALSEELRKEGFTHILFNIPIFSRWAARSLDRRDKVALTAFFRKYARLAYAKNGYFLYRLSD